jgi:hypothetical protein
VCERERLKFNPKPAVIVLDGQKMQKAGVELFQTVSGETPMGRTGGWEFYSYKRLSPKFIKNILRV